MALLPGRPRSGSCTERGPDHDVRNKVPPTYNLERNYNTARSESSPETEQRECGGSVRGESSQSIVGSGECTLQACH